MTANKSESDALLEQAIDWMIRTESNSDNVQLQKALTDWRAEDPAHEVAWQKAFRVWSVMGEVPLPDRSRWPEQVPSSADTPDRVRPPRRRCLRAVRRVAALAAVACLLIVAWPGIYLHIRADHMTGTGETRQVTLEDGSTVYLSAASAIRTSFSSGRRQVELLSGQAFFEVVSNPERPFVVNADSMEVTVLGTAFDVHLGSRLYVVSVQSGVVSVRDQEGLDRQLKPGQQLTVERPTGVAQVAQVSPGNVAAWREGRLFVHNRSLYDMVETLDRYYGGRIVIATPALGEQRVTGSFNLEDPDIALRGLVRPFNGRVWELTPLLRVLREP